MMTIPYNPKKILPLFDQNLYILSKYNLDFIKAKYSDKRKLDSVSDLSLVHLPRIIQVEFGSWLHTKGQNF